MSTSKIAKNDVLRHKKVTSKLLGRIAIDSAGILIADPRNAKKTAEEWDSTVKKLMYAPDIPGRRCPLNQFALDHRHYLLGKLKGERGAALGLHIWTPGDGFYPVYRQTHADESEFLIIDLSGS